MPADHVSERQVDAVIIGAGFGGCYLLKRLRDFGFRLRVFEEAAGIGGVWWHNRYPGARVDCDVPYYEFSDPELWNEWTWAERFPSQHELIRYFNFVDQKWNLSKDITFNTKVTEAVWNKTENRWIVHTSSGDIVHARFLLPAMGFAAKTYTPDIKGIDRFQGLVCHPAKWPKQLTSFEGKRVGVIGTGASGVQIIQELAPQVEQLVVFQRNPQCALPMRQDCLTPETQTTSKQEYSTLFKKMKASFAGFTWPPEMQNGIDQTPEARNACWEQLWAQGGFAPSHGNYPDLLTNLELNTHFYNFWRDKVRARLTNASAELIEELAPTDPPFPIGTKRPSLEQNYFEVFNQPNVTLVPLKKTPIAEFTSSGATLSSGQHIDLDALILATGYDAVTGSFSRVHIRGLTTDLSSKWSQGSRTALGISVADFPNLFFLVGPQSPAAWAIGPVIIEIQADWIIRTLVWMREHDYTFANATAETEEFWAEEVRKECDRTLLPLNQTTWYMAANVPGKPRESLSYIGGIPKYTAALQRCFENGLEGFVVK